MWTVAGDELERRLFILRKIVESRKVSLLGAQESDFYTCSLSNKCARA